MKRNHQLKELIEDIKKTDAMVSLHKQNNTSPLMAMQYEVLKAKQISELIDGLAMPPYQSFESISLIKRVINKFYPNIPEGLIKQKELKELEDFI